MTQSEVDALKKQNALLIAENAAIKDDLKKTKTCILQLFETLGIMQAGVMLDNKSKIIKAISSQVLGLLTKSEDQVKEKFGFMMELKPLLEKYKDL